MVFLARINTTTSHFGWRDKSRTFTEDVEDVAVKDGAVLVLHHTGVVSSV